MALLNQGYDYVPTSLQSLKNLNQLFVKQKVERFEAITGIETNNKYTIRNANGQNLFYAAEDTGCCTRFCLGSRRPFDMKIFDNSGNEVIHLHRDFACDSCCFPCCLQNLEVFSPPGNLIGTVKQNWSLCIPHFDIKNESGNTVLKIEGPWCQFNCCSNVEFHVMTLDKARVGKISKQWSGLLRETFTDSDFFGISFPEYLDVRMKAVMMGACFLIIMAMLNQGYDNLPPSLQCLKTLNKLCVKQKVECCEVCCGVETNNRYSIKNIQGENLFYVAEDTDFCTIRCWGSARPFDMRIYDNCGKEVIHLCRDLACDSCCFPWCLQKLEVYSPPGTLIGTVEQTWSICTPKFNIKNEYGNTVLKMEGPCCIINSCCDVVFPVLTRDRVRVGKISKKWSGMCRETCTDADFFKISFPHDLDVRMKVVLIGACFLIDFMYFEVSAGC